MMKCPVCNKSKSAFEMRPIVNIEELKVGSAMAEEKTERDLAGEKVDVVCRDCWMALLKNRSKEEVIEIMETICGILMEADRRMKERVPFGTPGDFILEKGAFPAMPNIQIQPMPLIQPLVGGTGIGTLPASDKIIWDGSSYSSIRLENQTQSNACNNMTVTSGFVEWFNALRANGGEDSLSSVGD